MTLRFSDPVQGIDHERALGARHEGDAGTISTRDVVLSLFEGTARGDARPGAWIAGPGVSDLTGNAALRGSVTPTDAAPPVMLAAATQDTGGKKGIDGSRSPSRARGPPA